ncbi:hypothetical protein [Endozoicomonas sp. GU-1]|uniref:hypothetical protein n=1 Tax=Endozoicomonas sp. GU-1 TaxID=3009078 RepID=UPI0022B557C4|nr:hypothetical protein [Endozoicomonas sp. GU-1]WBA81533.1 hypothetical protein O2T12_25230 [Endozoicomonas sp. GU-1]WBA84482.1 hypothetical protein O3276_14395 [Endozoicomonas sp. GU-1]
MQYSDKLAELRNLAGRYAEGERLEAFVAEHTERGMSLLEMHPNPGSLFERVSFMSEDTWAKLKKVLAEYGGLANCPEPQRVFLVGLVIHIMIGVEVLEKKYQHPEAGRLVPDI